MAELRRLRMEVEGMTCPDCTLHVQRALEAVGAKAVQVDLARREARFEAGTELLDDELFAAVRDAGYEPVAVRPLAAPEERRRTLRGKGDGQACDLAVIGSGSAAFAAAIRARDLGAKVVMVERGTVGGTCVNVGCIPSKALLEASRVYHEAGHHPFAGIATSAGAVDMARLVRSRDELVQTMRKEKYLDLVDLYGWELLAGEASFLDARSLRVGERRIEAGSILVATGASPVAPEIPGLQAAGFLTSEQALSLDRVPRRIAVIGAGYVALELGQMLRHLGSEVTIMQRGERLLAGYEPEIAAAMAQVLADDGIEVLLGVRYLGASGGDGGRELQVLHQGSERRIAADEILVAAGRRPNTAAMGLERAGVRTGGRGEILVGRRLETSAQGIFAAGDVTGGPAFVYVAAYEGSIAAENALGGSREVDLSATPACIFTSPQIASVGMTEEEAKGAGRDVKTAVLPLAYLPRAIVNRDTRGAVKLVADRGSGELLGAQMLAPGAGDAIYAATLAVAHHLTVDDVTATLAPYLTTAEGLRLAAQTFDRDVSTLSCCAG